MECLAHILARACKEGVQSIKYNYGEVDTKLTRRNIQKCITWTKKSHEGARALWEAQLLYRIKEKRLITLILTRFEYLIHWLWSLLDNKPMIEYLYGSIPGIHYNIRASRPYLVKWEIIQMIMTSVKRIVVIIILKQCSGKEWLLSEAIVDLVRIYTYCSGDDFNEHLYKLFDVMVEERGNS